jgi:hypothetical protein
MGWFSPKVRRLIPCYYPDEAIFQINLHGMKIGFDVQTVAMFLTWIGTACWGVCFWWMHRLSSRQETMLRELSEVAKRIEKFSKAEHDLIQDVQPKVEEIKESVEDVSNKVSEEKQS